MAIIRIPVEINNPTFPSTAVNVWHARVETAGDLFTGGVVPYDGPLGVLHGFYTAIAGMYNGSSTIRIPNVVVNVETDEELVASAIPIINGSGTDARAPQGLSVTCSWKTSIRARRGRGRTFIGPINWEVMQNDGTVADVPRTTIEAACQNLVNESSGVNGWAFGVWGQETAGVVGANVLRDFTGVTVAQKFAHLRSRRD